MAATAVEAWDERWTTPEGRADWLAPHPAVAALVPVLKARGTQHVQPEVPRALVKVQNRPRDQTEDILEVALGFDAGAEMRSRADPTP